MLESVVSRAAAPGEFEKLHRAARESADLARSLAAATEQGLALPAELVAKLAKARLLRSGVLDTWDTNGLRGTGSHDCVANELFVPEHRVFSVVDGPPPQVTRLHRFPLFGYFALSIAAAALGNARGAVDQLKTGIRLAATHVARTSAKVTAARYDLGGGATIYRSSPLERRFRDAHTATAHFQVNQSSFELPGKLLLGQPAQTGQL